MPFRRRTSFARFKSRGPRRRRTPYELAQLSVCRRGLEIGFSSCGVPDQFFQVLVSGKQWSKPYISTGDAAFSDAVVFPSRENKGCIVRGIQLDYQYSVNPSISSDPEDPGAFGAVSVRSALVLMELTVNTSQLNVELPNNPTFNILFHSEALLRDQDWGAGHNTTEFLKKYRILWRGMDMLPMDIEAGSQNSPTPSSPGRVPWGETVSRHVRLRTGCRLNMNQGLVWVTEIVNPFLTDHPLVGLDLLGTCVIKRAFGGNTYDD